MRFLRSMGVLAAALVCQAAAPTWDSSGNKMLNGTYYFREVIYALSQYGDGSLQLGDAVYGSVTFDGAGNYTMNAAVFSSNSGVPQSGSLKGTYTIGANGYGFLSHPLITGAYIYGTVSQNGVFVGSATATGYNDLMIAAPLASPAPTAASFKGSYTLAGMDLTGNVYEETPAYTLGYLLQLNPDGAGNLGSPQVSAYEGIGGSQVVAQTLGTTKYIFSNGAAVVSFPTNNQNAVIEGQEYLYFSADGNFVFGGSPQALDMIVGVKTVTGTPSFSGLYNQAGMDQDSSQLNTQGYALLDTYYGSLNASGGQIIEHQRLFDGLLSSASYDGTYNDSYSVGSNGTYSTAVMRYVVGAGGIRIGSGIGPELGINVALPAATVATPTSGVFLNPLGVVNAGSFAPFTAGLAPGELIVLYGANLAPDPFTVASAVPFPTKLDGVQVLVDGVAAPIYYTTPTQISAIVPYSATTSVVTIQVVNSLGSSNTVTNFSSMTAPGVLTQSQNGIGYGDVEHADGSLVTPQNPAQIGETVSVYLTGLGAVNPPLVPDGSAGLGVSPFNTTTNMINAYLNSTTTANSVEATVTYAGLAPGLAGLYQLNFTVPTGTSPGDNYLEIAGPDSDASESLISIAGASTTASAPAPMEARKHAGLKPRGRLKSGTQ